MPSPNKHSAREMVMLGLLIGVALVLSYFERFIPISFAVPGVKLGLANVVTLLCLGVYRPKRIYLLIFVRVLLASLFIGSMMSLWYSLTGALLSGTAMMIAYKVLGDKVSLIGISVLGAIFHNFGQMIVVSIITGSFFVAVTYLPVLLVSGIITGIFIGLVGQVVRPYVYKTIMAS